MRFSLQLIGALILGCPRLGAAPPPMDLGMAWKYALQHSPELTAAEASLEQAEGAVSRAGAVFLPALDLAASHGYQAQSPDLGGRGWSSSVGLELTQTFWDNGVSLTRWRLARKARERSLLQRDLARERAALRVARAFFEFSRAREIQGVEEEQLGHTARQRDLMESQFRAGGRSQEDVIRIRAQWRRGELSLLQAKTETLKAQRNLERTLGATSEGAFEFAPEIPRETVPELPKSPAPLEGTLLVRANQLQREINEESVSLVGRELWPVLTLTGSAGYGLSGYLGTGRPLNDTDRFGAGVRLEARFNLWDWGLRRRNLEIARWEQKERDALLGATDQDFRLELQTAWLDLGRAHEAFRVGRELWQLEKSNFETLQRDYRRGAVKYLDLVTALTNLTQAKASWIGAYFDLRTSLARHHFNEGKLHETLARL